MLPNAAFLYITNDCELHCPYCCIHNSEKNDYMSYEVFLKVMDFLEQNNFFIVALSGGDPAMHPDLIQMIKEIRCRRMLPVMGITGVNLSEDYKKAIISSGIKCIQLTLDGYDEDTNSLFRSENVFNEIINNMKFFQNAGINVNLATCVCRENFNNLEKVLDLFLLLKPYEVKIEFMQNNKEMIFHELSDLEKEKIIETCIEFEKKNNLKNWIKVDINFESEKFNYLKTKVKNIQKFIVYPDGDILKNENLPLIGNFKSMSFQDIKELYV